ncbi:MAG: NUDIX hydrolase, partial [Thiotrichaceae bacterium]|nr:NUDIX hydrolase [Thiotrichaceae bacterium]
MVKEKNEMLPIPTIGVGGIVFNTQDEVLMIKRNKAPASGQWSIPGGQLEPGESLECACRREVSEETGIEVEVKSLVAVVERRIENFHYVIIDFLVEIVPDTNIQPVPQTDVSAARWLPLSELIKYDVVQGLPLIIDRAFAKHKKNKTAGLLNTDANLTDFI